MVLLAVLPPPVHPFQARLLCALRQQLTNPVGNQERRSLCQHEQWYSCVIMQGTGSKSQAHRT